jgi:YggT family protein
MTQNFASAGVFLIQTFAGLYLLLLLLRFLMQVSRADYYNPICQGIVKLTDPVVKPLKKMLPTIRGVDFATLSVALLVQFAIITSVMLLSGAPVFHPIYLGWAMLGIVSNLLDIYFFALIIMVIASWIAPNTAHPALSLVHQLTDPICQPARKLLPPMGGLDLSIILVFVAITLIDTYLVIRPLASMLNVPPGLIPGLY